MVLCFPSTPRKFAMTVACFVSGAALFGFGLHLSYVNVAPQQARIKARKEFVLDTLKKKYNYTPPKFNVRQTADARVSGVDIICGRRMTSSTAVYRARGLLV